MTAEKTIPYLRIALQRSGRLSERSVSLIKECGISFDQGGSRLTARATNFSAEFLFLRDDDIPEYVADGVADIGIVGINVVEEKAKEIEVLEKLGFGRCRLSVAMPRSMEYAGVSDLNGLSIATSYPNILTSYLKRNSITAEIHTISGSAEVAPSIGLSDVICDLVSTGSTLLSNGLREVETILHSEAVLVRSKSFPQEKEKVLRDFVFRLRAVLNSQTSKYIVLNAPNEALPRISEILPGLKSPTVVPLADEGWSAMHAVVQEDQFWEILERLESEGAEGIVVLPIEKMII